MSLSNENGTVMTMPVAPAGYSGGGMGWGGDWASWIILFLIFGMYGYGGFSGYGGFGGGAGLNGAMTRQDLCGEFSFQDVKNGIRANGDNAAANFRAIDNAVCTLGYNNAQLANGIQMQIGTEARALDTNLCQLGNNIANQFHAGQITQLQGQNAIQTQLAGCCCDIREGIQANTTQGVMNTNAIQNQIQQCCCENEKISMQSRYDAAQAHCATLTAIDKVGDRIIDYLNCQQTQALRDENSALRQAASNQYVISQLRPPFPVPSYTVANPFAPVAGATA